MKALVRQGQNPLDKSIATAYVPNQVRAGSTIFSRKSYYQEALKPSQAGTLYFKANTPDITISVKAQQVPNLAATE